MRRLTARARFSAAILAVAVVAVLAVVLIRDGDDKSTATAPRTTATKPSAPRPKPKPASPLPSNPDSIVGTQDISLTRPGNLRRALRVLERERVRAEGVFDGLRVAPGRIDTTVKTPDASITLQVRPDLKISFRHESPFPNANDARFRAKGIGAGAVDTALPARILRRIDRSRGGSAARDIDYFVIRRDIIDGHVQYGAYMRTGPRPRIYLLEGRTSLRPIS
jgi:hypothetical protein